MTDFKIGSYSITNKEIYEVLKQENVSDGILSQLDVNGDKKIEEDELPILKFLIVENYCHGEKINPFDIPNQLHEFCMELDIIDALTWYQSHNKRGDIGESDDDDNRRCAGRR